ncbi:diaminopimelate epimerase [Caedibacter taeniospiralis]|uniref:diaminopimelate epimerase n=1 Tax=Caedibacter taeniospiralis TaxID=28907 RepID=UPI000C278003|nr:diaminopimelate epimerase [Caedibacter taeniospiralis]
MNKPLIFTKMCALGNDFVVIDERERPRNWQPQQVKQICDRRFGVGADQLLLIRKSGKADASMHIYNQDGSKAKQCGNGLRAVASLLLAEKNTQHVEIEVGGFVHRCQMIAHDWIQVAFPLPSIKPGQYIITDDSEFDAAVEVDVGNPHLVLWRNLNEAGSFDELGMSLQQRYQGGINVHAVKQLAYDRIYVEHWERGTGITPSCGSGSIACVFSGVYLGRLKPKVTVENAVSQLIVECMAEEVLLTGAIKTIFSGNIGEI